MAIATPTVKINETSSSSVTSHTTASFTPSSNGLTLVFAAMGDNNDFTGSVSISDSFGAGMGAWTEVELIHTSLRSVIICGIAVAGASPGSGTVTINTTETMVRWVVSVLDIASGFDSGTPLTQSKTDEPARATTQSITLDSALGAGAAVIGAVALRDEDSGVTPGTDFTESIDNGNGDGVNDWWLQVEYDLSPADGTADWSAIDSNGKDVLTLAIEIAAAAAAGNPWYAYAQQ